MKRIFPTITVFFFLSTLALAVGPVAVSDFGQVALGGSTSQAVMIPLTPAQLASAKQCALHYGMDFSVSAACSPTANGVRVTVSFQPKYAGLRQDAVIVEDGSGTLIAEAFVHGIGSGPMAAFRPGVIRQLLPSSGFGGSNSPWGLVADRENGFAYVAERNQSVVWQVKPDGTMAIYAGTANPTTVNSGDGGPATAASINAQAMALDPAGNLFIVSGGNIIRRVDSVTGIITTFAGGGSDTNGDGGPATAASLPTVTGLAVDAVGNLYLAVGTIRKVDAVTGIITTIAGSATASQYGDGGPALQAALGATEIAFDSVGNLYMTCANWFTVRKIDARTGIVSTVAGIPGQPTENPDQDGIPATSVSLYNPSGIAVDAAGDVYFGNGLHIRKVSAATGLVTSLNDGDASLFSTFAGEWTSLSGYPANMEVEIGYFGIDGAGNLFTPTMKIERDEGTLFFGQTSVGQTSAAQNFTIENIGNQTMQVTNTQASANFTSAGGCIGSMAAGQECPLSLSFNPGQSGGISGSVTVTDNSLNQAGAQQVSVLRGPWAQAIPFEAAVDFGATVHALQWSSPFSFGMQNPGDIPIHLTTVVSGPNASEFAFLNDSCGLAGTGMIAAQQTCYSWMLFEPLTAGPKSITLTITNDYDSTVQTITVTGTALPPLLPQISFSENSINFSGPQWKSGGIQTFTITNTGTASLKISQIGLQNNADPNLLLYPVTCSPQFQGIQPGQSCQLQILFSAGAATTDSNALVITDNAANSPQMVPITVSITQTALQFVPVTPCRIADTRVGSTPIAGQSSGFFTISNAACGIPASAAAYSLNVTAVPAGGLGYLSIGPLGTPLPLVSTLNSDGRVKANAAIVGAGDGGVQVYVSDKSDVILDINGYFAPAATTNNAGLTFYPVTPCRIADTRNNNGPLGGPALSAGVSRTFPILSSSCNLPSGAQAYSLNFTAIPHTWLGYLSTWPTGQTRPLVSTLNSPGEVTANAALVPAGTNGSIDVFASNDADLVIDVDGYFATPGTGGLSFYSVPPCRAIDTRMVGSGAPFNGTIQETVTSTCGVPSTASAVALNATVVPTGPLWYLTLWPDGATMPVVSTLNSDSGKVASNMAIVPTTNGSIDAFGTNQTQIILDIAGYFAP